MKKIFALLLVLCMATALLVGCGGGDADSGKLKIGVILIGDENEGYTFAHIKGIKDAVKALGEDKIEVIWKYTVGEDEKAYNAAIDLVEQGCTYIFSNSYGHQSHMLKAAQENPEVNFVAVTGDTAKTANLDNFSNAFNDTYESRYVSGVVAGMKIKELVEGNKLTDKNYRDGKVKIGYVGAFPYAEVVSGYTAFYLGIKSVYADVVMDVSYTNSWFSIPDEGAAAEAFIADGCVIISQHADSTGAPSAVQAKNKEGTVVYC
ncbi:MAG: BMP family ABC transporter substrate-binding protein, partial [Clostridia bacterium]|nr:BMP family ABC transporter substrate-binding protein [Clostridia bacterium]